MIILTTSASQTIKIIPTLNNSNVNYDYLKFEFTNETTKTKYVRDWSDWYYENDILNVEFPNNFLVENTFYNLRMYVNAKTIYKDRVFVTNQIQGSYSINSGEYTTPAIDNNNYITI